MKKNLFALVIAAICVIIGISIVNHVWNTNQVIKPNTTLHKSDIDKIRQR